MSEMKPVFWIKKEHFAEFDGARGDLGLTIVAWNNSLNEYAKAHELKSMEVPLYTAEQLAEAVAAEREKNATYLNAFWAAASLDGEEVVVTIKLRALFIMDEKVKDTIRRVLNGSAAK